MSGRKTTNDSVPQNVLIVSGDGRTRRLVLEVLAGRGVRGTVARSAESARRESANGHWHVVLVDLDADDAADEKSPPGSAKLIRSIKRNTPDVPVVAICERRCVERAVQAMREGCDDVLVKPVEREALESLLEATVPNHDVPMAACDEQGSRCLYQIAGKSGSFLSAVRLARRVAPTSVPVLITGESGTGKELLSYLIHHESPRSCSPYVRVNCAALSESLLESELFGHERGAFTGAIAQRKGRFERAHAGTLLLDEISETTPRLQAELLRVLEQQDFERVGGSEPVRVDVRVLCTSNRDLARDVRAGRFRADLYYRICGVHVRVPPLRERADDLPVLVWHFVNLYAREVRRKITELDPKMLRAFREYHWPGNVRQLRNIVRTMLILGEGATLSLEGQDVLKAEPAAPESPKVSGTGAGGEQAALSLQDVERRAIFEALRRTRSHQAKAASLLGITDRTLREKLRRYRRDGYLQEAGEEKWLTETV